MHRKLITISIYTYILFLCVSCRFQSKKVEPILEGAKSLLESRPDSALLILDEIKNPELLKKSLYYEYYLMQVQAKDKSYKQITSDTLIFSIRDYYVKEKNAKKAALAAFYCGRVLQDQKKYEKALLAYFNAEKYLSLIDDDNLKGLYQSSIATIYYHQYLTEEAIAHFKLAAEYFHRAESYRNEVGANRFIGNSFLVQKDRDSAILYLSKSLELADRYKLPHEQFNIRIGLGIAFRQNREWEESLNFYRDAWAYAIDSLERTKLSSNFAALFEAIENNDSTLYYLQQAVKYLPKETNRNLAANIYRRWSAFEEHNSNFEEALERYKLYTKHLAAIINENRNSAVMEIEKKYNFQKVENQNKQLLIERQRGLLFSLVLLMVLIILIALYISHVVKHKRTMEDAEQKIFQLKEMARSFNEKESSFHNVLIRHLDILKKAALLEGYLKEAERRSGKKLLRKFNEVVYGQKELDWNILYDTLNNASNGFLDQMKSDFPHLEESEFRICALIFVECNNTEIAIILNYSVSTVQVKKSTIRRKLGVKTFGDIREYLLQ